MIRLLKKSVTAITSAVVGRQVCSPSFICRNMSNFGMGRKDVFGLFPFDEKAVGNKISIKIVFVMHFELSY